MNRNYFHLHLVSDSTGETLIAVSRAASAQYQGIASIEHIYPLIRNLDQLERVIAGIQSSPGIVLYTLVDTELAERLERRASRPGRLPFPFWLRSSGCSNPILGPPLRRDQAPNTF